MSVSVAPLTGPARVSARPTAVVATVPSDSHTWNLVFLQLLLEENGLAVTNLGACTPAQLCIDTVRAQRPDLLVISSVNGHGLAEGEALMRELLIQDPQTTTRCVIGGKLGIDGNTSSEAKNELLAAGYSAVHCDSEDDRSEDPKTFLERAVRSVEQRV